MTFTCEKLNTGERDRKDSFVNTCRVRVAQNLGMAIGTMLSSAPGAPNENIVQNHLNIALSNVF